MRIRSIKTSVLLIAIPSVLLAMIALSLLGYLSSRKMLEDSINYEMELGLNRAAEYIEKVLSKNLTIAESMARAAEVYYQINPETSEADYGHLIEKLIASNDEIFGGGLWFEPYKLYTNKQYAPVYCMRKNGILECVREYASNKGRYDEQEWYSSVKGPVYKTAWSKAYRNNHNAVSMVTASAPFYDKQGSFMGVATCDIDLTKLQKTVLSLHVPTIAGKTFLLDTDGSYIATDDSSKLLNLKIQDEANLSLAELGRAILSREHGTGHYYINDEKHLAWFARVPESGWFLALTISEEQLMKDVSDLGQKLLLLCVLFLVISGAALYAYLNFFVIRPLKKLTWAAGQIAEGRLNIKLNLQSKNEIGLTVRALQKTAVRLNKYRLYIQEITGTLTSIAQGRFDDNLKQEYSGEFVKLKKALEHCARQVEEMRREIMGARQHADKASEAKSQFISHISHEMRSPMNAIIGMVKIARNIEDTDKLKYCINMIGESSAYLLGLINDVLDMAKIEAGKLELEMAPFNIEKMLMKAGNIIASRIEQKNLCFHVFIDTNAAREVMGDELRLSQVINNLLSNAVKFTPENGTITLRVTEEPAGDNHSLLTFAVTDTGIGMSKEQLGKLFNSFQQADGTISKRFGGTGLGLSISKRIVQMMDGQINVSSELGKGSTFGFSLRMERLEKTDEAYGDYPAGITALVVEGNKPERDYLHNMLKRFGIKSDEAEGAPRALELASVASGAGKPYDIVFINCQLADMSGIEASRRIGGFIPQGSIVLMTSFLNWSRIEETAHENGIRHFISKPLFPSIILETVHKIAGTPLNTLEKEDTLKHSDFSNVTLLLVDDIKINRHIFSALLSYTKVNIEEAENGAEALAMFSAEPDKYDIIIMDIQMPVMDGYEASNRIRDLDNSWAKSVPIIAMTANAFREDIEKCLAAGMNDHLAKPIDENMVIEKIKKYLLK